MHLIPTQFVRVFLLLTVGLLVMIGCGGGSEEDEIIGSITETLPTDTLTTEYLAVVPAELGGEGFVGEGWLSNEDYETIADPRAVKGGTFTWRSPDFPSTLRSIGKDNNTWINSIIEGMIYESLVGIHSTTLEIVPNLATHWKIKLDTTNVDTPQTFWFRINPKARFADGSPVTAYDVVATWRLKMDPGIMFPSTQLTFGQYYEPVAESPYIVRVSTKELNWRLFLYIGGASVLPEKYIGHYTGAEFLKKYQFEMVPGSGTYELNPGNIVKGRSLTLTRRNDYWDQDNPKSQGSSNFDRIKFLVVQDERLAFEKFKKGELDVYVVNQAKQWAEETDFPNVQRGLIQKRRIFNDEPQGTSGFVFNMRVPPFDDHRMRLAFTHLVNRQKWIDELFFNQYTFMDSYYPGGVYENPDNPIYRYDPDKAARLLAECGYSERNEQGWLINDRGEMLELDLMFASKSFERILTVFQGDLQQAGIKLNLKQSTGPTMFKMVMERKFKLHWQSWTGLTFPNPETSYSSALADSNNTNNLSGVKNERIDQLLKEYNITFDQQRRVEIIREIDGILMEIQPMALGWYAEFTRILYWNKFGHPEPYIGRTSRWYYSIPGLWWIDPDKEARLEEARRDESIQLDVGEVDVRYWQRWNEEHGGRSYTSDF